MEKRPPRGDYRRRRRRRGLCRILLFHHTGAKVKCGTSTNTVSKPCKSYILASGVTGLRDRECLRTSRRSGWAEHGLNAGRTQLTSSPSLISPSKVPLQRARQPRFKKASRQPQANHKVSLGTYLSFESLNARFSSPALFSPDVPSFRPATLNGSLGRAFTLHCSCIPQP